MSEDPRTDRLIADLAAGLMVDISELIPKGDQEVLLRLALGRYTRRIESRFRHQQTGETVTQLDLRKHDFADWASEQRTVIESEWRTRP